MKADNPISKPIFCAQQSTDNIFQPQDKHYAMPDSQQHTSHSQQAPLNESHKNLMQSWQNLRGLDRELAARKHPAADM